ncbi:M23 family metallopeptidase [Dietzia aurantiaca]|uniref:M23 family metallopeptidase n=1 Tax=Dietzia aurantiaca TaxID=983873 RepID=UPI001E520D0B|nr:M23 family metallopeptidase [Dietzia aurantiaca]
MGSRKFYHVEGISMSNSLRAVPFADLMVSLGVETPASSVGRHRASHTAGIGRIAAITLAGAAIASGAALSAAPAASAQSSDLEQIGQMVQEVGAQHGIGAEQVREYASQVPGLDQLGLGSVELPVSGNAHKPTDGTVTSSFGPRWGSNHSGTDFGAPIGTPLYAAKSGTVVASGPVAGYGLWIRIQTDDGYLLEYGHNNANYVAVGERVTAGQVIGEVGNRGDSTGPHLHLGVQNPAGQWIDSVSWLAANGVIV